MKAFEASARSFLFVVFYIEIVEMFFHRILSRKTGITQIAFFGIPFRQATVIEQLDFISDDEGNNLMFQTFFEKEEPSNPAIAVLKWVDPLKLHMEIKQGIEG